MNREHRLAYHETLELLELITPGSAAIVKMKQILPSIVDPELKQLYMEAIQLHEGHLRDLIAIVPNHPPMP